MITSTQPTRRQQVTQQAQTQSPTQSLKEGLRGKVSKALPVIAGKVAHAVVLTFATPEQRQVWLEQLRAFNNIV